MIYLKTPYFKTLILFFIADDNMLYIRNYISLYIFGNCGQQYLTVYKVFSIECQDSTLESDKYYNLLRLFGYLMQVTFNKVLMTKQIRKYVRLQYQIVKITLLYISYNEISS